MLMLKDPNMLSEVFLKLGLYYKNIQTLWDPNMVTHFHNIGGTSAKANHCSISRASCLHKRKARANRHDCPFLLAKQMTCDP